jgi:hypothetical protein
MENAVIFYGHLNILRSLGIFLWPFGNVVSILVYFPSLWYIVPRKIWQP